MFVWPVSGWFSFSSFWFGFLINTTRMKYLEIRRATHQYSNSWKKHFRSSGQSAEYTQSKITTTQMMSGGFLMFPKIVSETGICFTKASIYLTGMDFLCKHRLSDWMLNPWQELGHPQLRKRKFVLVKLLNQ